MKHNTVPTQANFWYVDQCHDLQVLDQDLTADVVIVGAGMAGISAAHAFAKEGKRVIVLEKNFFGAGASGKAAGFITNNAELSFNDFKAADGGQSAQEIWKFISQGSNRIRSNVQELNLICGYKPATSLLLATCQRSAKKINAEYQAILEQGLKSEFFEKQDLLSVIGTNSFHSGMTYQDTFGIDTYAYLWAMHDHLKEQGVLIFQDSEVINIVNNTVFTRRGKVTAEHIVLCVDRFLPDLDIIPESVYHAQNMVLASNPLSPEQVATLFPREEMMVWDTELLYNYFRLTSDNRIILGGSSLWTTYQTVQSSTVVSVRKKLMNYWAANFPKIPLDFGYEWTGMIGISKDLQPLIGKYDLNPHVYFISASAGLPIAAALGYYSAEHILHGRNDMDQHFNAYRNFAIQGIAQKILGKKVSFALSNFMAQKTPSCLG